MMMRFAPLLLILVMISACAKNPATGSYNLMLLSEDNEFELGHGVASKHIKENGLYKEKPEFTAYYQELGRELVTVTERSDKPFEFIILDNHQVNAWAIPGYINMYRGILPLFNSEAEFMTVVAHEAGHITARHSARTRSAGLVTGVGLTVALGVLGAATENDALTNVAGAAGVFAAQAGFSKFSRVNEDEADELALKYIAAMGYDPREAVDTFLLLDRFSKLRQKVYRYFNDGKDMPDSPFYDLMSSHPPSDYRAQKVAERVGTWEVDTNQGQERYYQMIDGMAFGPRAYEQGVATRNTLYLPEKRMKMTFPDGYYFDYVNQWQGYHAEHKTKLRITRKTVDKNEDPEETLRVMFPKLRGFEPVRVGGLEGYMGTMATSKRDHAFAKKEITGIVRIVGIKGTKAPDVDGAAAGSRRQFYLFAFRAPGDTFEQHDPSFLEMVQSFKALTTAEAEAVQPLRVKIVTAASGDTVSSLSEKMALSGLREDWFRVMNAIDPEDEIVPGQLLKLIVDPNEKQ